MAKRPTIQDLARAAKVSTATVDRVINGRHKVRKETAQRVYEMANEIGYHAAGLIKQRIQEKLPTVKFGFILQKSQHFFIRSLPKNWKRLFELILIFRVSVKLFGQRLEALVNLQT